MKKMNKAGEDEVMTVWWFAVVFLSFIGIGAIAYLLFDKAPLDVRDVEANILLNKLADCVSYAGRINSEIFSGGKFNPSFNDNLLENCHLVFESSEDEAEQYYAEINFYPLATLGDSAFSISAGNKNFLPNCDIQKEKEYNTLARCVEKKFYSLGSSNEQYIIKILTIVGNVGKNVKI